MIAPRTFFRSLRHALHGLCRIFREEQNFRAQVAAALLAVAASIALRIALWEAIVIILLCAGILVLEVLNTIVERLSDAVQPRLSHVVREVKDMMAGTVLLAAVAAAIVGAVIFLPYLLPVLGGGLASVRSMLY